jgi:two-component system, chemotaxis family, chemotaxis protein CheY
MPAASSLTVLVVDDQHTIRALVRGCLSDMGCRDIVECEDGEAAFERLRFHPAKLIISDLNMPKLDGLGLLRKVREDPILSDTPFIMLTSRGEVDLVRQAIALKVNNYLTKPFTFATLRSKIEAVLGPVT